MSISKYMLNHLIILLNLLQSKKMMTWKLMKRRFGKRCWKPDVLS